MYSEQSRVLCVNIFRLNPYAHSHTNSNQPITLHVLKQLQSKVSDTKKKEIEDTLFASEPVNSEEPEDRQLRFPVCLSRNKRLMKQIRKDLDLDSDLLTASNGLVMRQVPHIKKLYF